MIHKILKKYTLNKVIVSMVSHMVFLTKLGFENLKNLVTPSPFCKVGRVTELLDGRITSSPWKTKNFQGLDDDFGLKRPNHHLGPEYVHIFRARKVWFMGRLFWEIWSFMQKPWRTVPPVSTYSISIKLTSRSLDISFYVLLYILLPNGITVVVKNRRILPEKKTKKM